MVCIRRTLVFTSSCQCDLHSHQAHASHGDPVLQQVLWRHGPSRTTVDCEGHVDDAIALPTLVATMIWSRGRSLRARPSTYGCNGFPSSRALVAAGPCCCRHWRCRCCTRAAARRWSSPLPQLPTCCRRRFHRWRHPADRTSCSGRWQHMLNMRRRARTTVAFFVLQCGASFGAPALSASRHRRATCQSS